MKLVYNGKITKGSIATTFSKTDISIHTPVQSLHIPIHHNTFIAVNTNTEKKHSYLEQKHNSMKLMASNPAGFSVY